MDLLRDRPSSSPLLGAQGGPSAQNAPVDKIDSRSIFEKRRPACWSADEKTRGADYSRYDCRGAGIGHPPGRDSAQIRNATSWW